jgi:cation:H+ antiporter
LGKVIAIGEEPPAVVGGLVVNTGRTPRPVTGAEAQRARPSAGKKAAMARFFAFRGPSERRRDLITTLEFVVALVAILLGAAFFTNAVEILGGRLGMRQGAVGSLLAAVGTALPESMIAIVAILEPVMSGDTSGEGALIGIGAILGAPFMLATLAMFVVGVSAVAFRGRRDQGTDLRIDPATIGRDVGFFLVFFAVAAGVGLVELPMFLKVVIAIVLAFGYGLYVRRTLTSGEHLEEMPERLLILPRSDDPPLGAVVFQTLASLGVILAGAHFFVDAVEHAAEGLGLPAGLIALVLAPLATELPEKFNSIFWMRDGKDTLALGNVTGAMMFQSTIPVAFGVLFTPWNLQPLDLFAVVLALASGGLVFLNLRRSGTLRAGGLMLGGLFYLAFVIGAIIAVT